MGVEKKIEFLPEQTPVQGLARRLSRRVCSETSRRTLFIYTSLFVLLVREIFLVFVIGSESRLMVKKSTAIRKGNQTQTDVSVYRDWLLQSA